MTSDRRPVASADAIKPQQVLREAGRVVLGKEHELKLALVAFLAGGHTLIEDRPGVGKTTMGKALAQVLGLGFQRIQFTSDLLPSDIVGVSIYETEQRAFRFHPGPLFNEFVLADEINRATPKTQSALLEAMAEGTVTVDGEQHQLPQQFHVIATQNPVDLAGTFQLPDSQLDRFLMRIQLGYPQREAELQMLAGDNPSFRISDLRVLGGTERNQRWRHEARQVKASEALLEYIYRLVSRSREHQDVLQGLSPRAALALLAAARAWAWLDGRQHVLPDDIRAVFVPIANHRLISNGDREGWALARSILEQTPVEAGKAR